MNTGWIKISRDIADWQHYQEPSVVLVFIDLLLHANYEDTWFRGVKVKRGENVNSIRKMAQRLGMSVNTVQTALRKLVETGEIIRTPFKYGIKTTIRNYDQFQDVSTSVSNGVSDSVSKGVSKTDTFKEDKNKEDICVVDIRARLENETINNSAWLDQTSMALRTTDVLQLAMDVMTEWELTKVPPEKWTAGHLYNHIRKKLDIKKAQARPTKQEEKAAWRARMLQSIQNDLMYGNTSKQ